MKRNSSYVISAHFIKFKIESRARVKSQTRKYISRMLSTLIRFTGLHVYDSCCSFEPSVSKSMTVIANSYWRARGYRDRASVIVDELDARREANIAGTRRQRDEGLAMRQPRGSPTNRRDCKSSRDQIASGYIINPTGRTLWRLLRADAATEREKERERKELCIATFHRSILWVRTAYFYEIRLKESFPILRPTSVNTALS